MKSFLSALLISAIFIQFCFTQDKPANPQALELFIEGKTLELQDNYVGAIQKYNEALKIEKAAGIYYTISKMYYNVSQYQKAVDNGLEALKIAPKNSDYLENIADCYIILNDYDNALKYLLEVDKLKPDDINILYNIGRVYEAVKQPSQAIKYYERITEDLLYDENVLARMVEIYEGYKDYLNSAAAQEKLLVLNPADLQLKYRIAATYLKIPNYENALRIYEDVMAVNGFNREIQAEIIKIYFRQNRTDLAFEKFGRLTEQDSLDYNQKMTIALAFFDASSQDSSALPVVKSILQNIRKSYPNDWLTDYYLAMIDIRENNFGIAEEKFKKIIVQADTSIEAHVLIGFTYYELRKFDEAIKVFSSGAEKFPDEFRLQYLTGDSYYRMGKQKEALLFLEKAKKINPKDLNVLSTLGLLYDNLNMNVECDRHYTEALQYYPDNILLLNNYAYHLSEIGKDLEKAQVMSKKTIDAEPNSSSYLDTYGWILFKMKDYKNAAKYIEKAVSINSNSAVLLFHLGDIYEAMGEIVRALKYWKLSLEKDPNNKDVIYKIEKYK